MLVEQCPSGCTPELSLQLELPLSLGCQEENKLK